MFVNVDTQRRDAPLLIQDLSNVLTTGLPANPSAADQQAFNAGVAELTSKFPGGAPGNRQTRTFNQTLLLGKFDAMLNPSNLLSVTHNYLNAHGERAIQTPLVLGNVGRNGSDDVRIQSFNVRLTTTSGRWVNELRMHRANGLRHAERRRFAAGRHERATVSDCGEVQVLKTPSRAETKPEVCVDQLVALRSS